MKKEKKVPMESSPYCPSSSSYSVPVGGEEEAKARSRHRSLMLDYLELQKEIEAKRRKLMEANKKKHKLSTVVKFLRRKFKSLSKKPSQKIQVRVKKHSHKLLLPPLNVQSKVPLKDGQEVREASVPSTTALFDLNQIIPFYLIVVRAPVLPPTFSPPRSRGCPPLESLRPCPRPVSCSGNPKNLEVGQPERKFETVLSKSSTKLRCSEIGDEMNDIQVGMGSPVTDLSNMTFVNGDVEKRKIPWQDQMAVGA